jgi:hypothetical protein
MEALVSIVSSVINYFNAPALALVVMFIGAFYVLHAAQAREDFDLGNILKNENGKESLAAMGGLVAIILSGWCLVYSLTQVKDMNSDTFVTLYALHLVVWSGTKVAEKLVDAVSAKWSGKSVQ